LPGRQFVILDEASHQYNSVKDFGNFIGSVHTLNRLEGVRTQSSILRYNSPTIQGFKCTAHDGLGERAGQSFGAGGTYDNDPLVVYLSYCQSKFGADLRQHPDIWRRC